MVKLLSMTLGTLAGGVISGATAASADEPTPAACRAGEAEQARCRAIYESGYRMTCFRDGDPVFEGEVWLPRREDTDPLPHVRANGEPVEPLWQRYGACKIRRAE